MCYNLYVIYDNIAKESGFPFDAKNDDVAVRKFQSFIKQIENNPNSVVSDNEFTLKRIAEYDSENCQLCNVFTSNVDLLIQEEK